MQAIELEYVRSEKDRTKAEIVRLKQEWLKISDQLDVARARLNVLHYAQKE